MGMIRDIDEQHLTAYALGESQSSCERAAVEARLAGQPAARRRVEQVRVGARTLADALAAESADASRDDGLHLTDLQRAAIERRLVEPRPILRRGNQRHWPVWGSIAASLAIVATVTATVVVPLLRGSFGTGGTGRAPGISPAGSDEPIGPIPPPAVGLPGRPDTQAVTSLPGATRPAWSDLPVRWPVVPDVPFAGEGTRADALHNAGFVRVIDRPVFPCPNAPVYPDDANVDRGSFRTIRQSLERGQLPPAGAVRTEELINALAGPLVSPNMTDAPALTVEVANCPWADGHRVVRVTLTAPHDIPAAGPAPEPIPSSPAVGLHDVSVRIEFDPETAAAYRLIGYEGPDLRPPAPTVVPEVESPPPGQIPPGRSLTVLYEVIPNDRPPTPASRQLLNIVLRFRDGPTGPPRTMQVAARDHNGAIDAASPAFRAAAAAATFGMALREDNDRGSADFDLVSRLLAGEPGAADTAQAALLQASEKAKALTRPPSTQGARG